MTLLLFSPIFGADAESVMEEEEGTNEPTSIFPFITPPSMVG